MCILCRLHAIRMPWSYLPSLTYEVLSFSPCLSISSIIYLHFCQHITLYHFYYLHRHIPLVLYNRDIQEHQGRIYTLIRHSHIHNAFYVNVQYTARAHLYCTIVTVYVPTNHHTLQTVYRSTLLCVVSLLSTNKILDTA